MGANDRQINEVISSLPKSDIRQIKFGDIFPSYHIPTITKNKTILSKWGFTRYDKKGLLINARAETVRDRAMFSRAFQNNRCVIPASGFYEWDLGKNKHYFFPLRDILYLGGFIRFEGSESRAIILTKQATEPISSFHDRIPVILDRDSIEPYLSDNDFANLFILADNKVKLNAK